MKIEGKDNDLLERLEADPAFAHVNIKGAVTPKRFIGRSPQQVDEFIKTHVTPIRRRYRSVLARKSDLFV